MEENQETFDKYYQYTTKSSPFKQECDEDCKKREICNIRAGRSEQRCDYDKDVFEVGSTNSEKRYKPEPHNCALNLVGIRARYSSSSLINK